MKDYIPGKGYRDGYQDRQQGKPNLSIIETSILENQSQYWEEYKLGYSEASKRIIEDARSTINEKIFLVE
jgi:hypothetical protein